MPTSFPLDRAAIVVANGSHDDQLVNHTELREGLGDQAFPSSVSDDQLDVVIAAYGDPGVGALSETQLRRAFDDHVIQAGNDGRMEIDFNRQSVSTALSDAVVRHGSSDDLLLNRDELRGGFERLGFDVPFTREMADVLIKGYGGANAVVVGQDDLRRALDDGAVRVDNGAVSLDFRSPLLAAPLARSIVATGSRDDGLVNASELRDGLKGLGFDPRIDDDAIRGLIDRYGGPGANDVVLDADQVAHAIANGGLSLDGGGNLVSQVQPAYDQAIATNAPFATEVRGTQPKPIDRDLSVVAAAVYDPNRSQAGNFSRVSDAELRGLGVDPRLLQDDSTSFKAGIYRNAAGQVVLAYAGTEGITAGKDWWTNAKQGLGFDAKQYREAVELAGQAQRAFGSNLVVTGHSLGGGLAATASLVHDIPAVTFNAAGVNSATLTRNGLQPEDAFELAQDGLIRRYVVEGEFLNYGQDRLPVPNAPGRLIALPDPAPPSYPPSPFDIPFRIVHSIKLHDIAQVTSAIDADPPWQD